MSANTTQGNVLFLEMDAHNLHTFPALSFLILLLQHRYEPVIYLHSLNVTKTTVLLCCGCLLLVSYILARGVCANKAVSQLIHRAGKAMHVFVCVCVCFLWTSYKSPSRYVTTPSYVLHAYSFLGCLPECVPLSVCDVLTVFSVENR